MTNLKKYIYTTFPWVYFWTKKSDKQIFKGIFGHLSLICCTF